MGIPVRSVIAGCVLLLGLAACNGGSTGSEPVLNVYQWSDYVAPGVIQDFEREYGIRVNYDVFDSNEVLETKMLMGHSNFDVVAPSGPFLQRQVTAGVYQKLNKSLLPNLKYVDPEVAREFAVYSPGNEYAVDYMWITSGPGYNVAKIRERMPDAPVDSLRMIFDPTVVSKFKDCGVSVLDEPTEIVSIVLAYLGKDPHSNSQEDLQAAEKVLLSIRPYLRYIHSSRYIDDLANGETCLALGWSGDIKQARDRAREAGKGIEIKYNIPREGTIMNFDMLAIPADAPHPGNALTFINYLLDPEVAAKNSNHVKFANINTASTASLDEAVKGDPNIYPPPDILAKLVPQPVHGQDYQRLLTRTWTRFKTGK